MDWWGEDRNCWPNKVSSPRELGKYRGDYEGYLKEACLGENGKVCDGAASQDWQFTCRSAMSESIVDAISAGQEAGMWNVLKAVLGMFLLRIDVMELVRQIGSGEGGMGKEMRAFFMRGFEEVFETEGKSGGGDDDGNGVFLE